MMVQLIRCLGKEAIDTIDTRDRAKETKQSNKQIMKFMYTYIYKILIKCAQNRKAFVIIPSWEALSTDNDQSTSR